MRKGNKLLILLFLLLFVGGVCFGAVLGKHLKDKKKEEPPVKDNVDITGLSNFDLIMFRLANNKGNMVYSPLSIKYALSLVDAGASGETKTQIDKVIGTEKLSKYDNIKDHLSLANAVFIKETFKDKVKDSYIKDVKDNFNSEVVYDEFKSASNINKWIEEKTFNMLKNVLNDQVVTHPDSEMIVVNALAIDMEWYRSFDEEATGAGKFTKADGKSIEAAMMLDKNESGNKDFKYYKDDDIVLFSKDLKAYEGKQFEFIGIMPREVSLDDYITNLKDDGINDAIGKLINVGEKDEVRLHIPKFDYEFEMSNFKDNLVTLGIKDMFDPNKADFSGISDRPLYVSDAIHKAKIEFSEKGVKAAAVTAFMFRDSAIHIDEKNIIDLNFDKPFMFVIRDKETKEVWFMGTVYEPTLWKDEVAKNKGDEK